MKPFLGIDLTENKRNEQANGREFLVQTPSAAMAQTLEASAEKAEETTKKAKLPLFFRILQYVCGGTALILAAGILRADVSFAEGYQNASVLHWVAGACAVIWLILWLCGKRKAKSTLGTDESAQTFSHLERVADAVYQELGIPDGAKDADVLFFFYKIKDGEIKLVEKAIATQYYNPEFKVFSDDENLYLANLEGKYAFPLSSIAKMHTVEKRIRIAGWNKEEPFNMGDYKQYKLAKDNYGCIHCKKYHILEIEHQGETFGIYFPCYELPVFEKYAK